MCVCSAIAPYKERADDSAGTKLAGSALNAVIIMGVLFCTTVLFFCLYKYRCIKVPPLPMHALLLQASSLGTHHTTGSQFIYGWLIVSTGTLLAIFGGQLI